VALGGWVFLPWFVPAAPSAVVPGPFWACCLASPGAAWLAAPHEHGRNSTPAGSSAERIGFLMEAGFVNFELFLIG
jgi:hypothetical protein